MSIEIMFYDKKIIGYIYQISFINFVQICEFPFLTMEEEPIETKFVKE
jgi:hypothetical protein